jgi:hypothetical protein
MYVIDVFWGESGEGRREINHPDAPCLLDAVRQVISHILSAWRQRPFLISE